jgi:hypothetical protein
MLAQLYDKACAQLDAWYTELLDTYVRGSPGLGSPPPGPCAPAGSSLSCPAFQVRGQNSGRGGGSQGRAGPRGQGLQGARHHGGCAQYTAECGLQLGSAGQCTLLQPAVHNNPTWRMGARGRRPGGGKTFPTHLLAPRTNNSGIRVCCNRGCASGSPPPFPQCAPPLSPRGNSSPGLRAKATHVVAACAQFPHATHGRCPVHRHSGWWAVPVVRPWAGSHPARVPLLARRPHLSPGPLRLQPELDVFESS